MLLRVTYSTARCAFYDNCGKTSYFGADLPCSVSSDFIPEIPSQEDIDYLVEICGDEWQNINEVCCTKSQIMNLKNNFKKVSNIISSCPACEKNFNNLFCHFTCSPIQRDFINITKTQISMSKKEVVSELDFFLDPRWASEFYDSCKDVKFSATNGYAMDFIGGGAENYSEFLRFLGDKKPMLGGSPFQINYIYDDIGFNYSLFNDTVYACNDETYKCSCTDCNKACPILPNIDKGKCMFGTLPCVSSGILILYGILSLLFGIHRIYVYKKKYTLGSNPLATTSNQKIGTYVSHSLFCNYITETYFLNDLIGNFFGSIAERCVSHAYQILMVSLVLTFFFGIGILKFSSLETDPINLWVSKTSEKYIQKQYFDEHFGPFYRIEQFFIVNDTGPVLSYENLKWWFEVENNITKSIISNSGISYQDICFRPDADSTCVIESLTQYFNGILPEETTWEYDLRSCTNSPIDCLPSFQQPLKSNVLFSDEDIFNSKAIIITLIVNNHTNAAIEWEKALEDYSLSLDLPEGLRMSFSTEMSLQSELNGNNDVFIVCISYLTMFIYASWALKSKNGETRLLLGFFGIIVVFCSLIYSVGLLSIFHIKSTLIVAEVIPFLILAIGIDNIFLISHEFDRIRETNSMLTIQEGIVKTVKRISPSILLSSISQISCFLIATFVTMPAVRNFAIYSAVSLIFNVILQFTLYISLLALYTTHYEENIQLERNREALSLNNIEVYQGIWDKKKKIFGGFIIWTLISIIFIPYFEFGLDQTMAIPQDSYLVQYFNDVYQYLNVGPPVYFIVQNLDLTQRDNQYKICGRFTKCNEFSLANILEQERGRSTIIDPITNWFDDFMMFLNPNLDQCCRFKKGTHDVCPPFFPSRKCDMCFMDREWNYDMTGFPQHDDFMNFFNIWINSPSDPCPLGGKIPYASSIYYNESGIISSIFRTAHKPLRSQIDYISAYHDAERLCQEMKELDVFAYSPFYIFFSQYTNLSYLTFKLISIAILSIFIISTVLLGSISTSIILVVTLCMVITNIGASMVWFNIPLNAVSLVNLVICVGLSVEFCVHIAKAFTNIPIGIQNDRDSRIKYATQTVGKSIFKGITMTKFVGVSILSLASSKIFQVFYFKMWFLLILIASIHALVFLPVALSMFGGKSFADSTSEVQLQAN